ncbi:MAG: hypothetical protein R3A52_14975 [Polyangiales bacterium]
MKRWRSALGPCAVVVAMNAAAIARDRSSFETCVRGLGPYEFAVLAVSAVCAALLGVARVRGARPWVLLIPVLPCVTALLGGVAKLHEAQPALVRSASVSWIGNRSLSVIEVFKEAGRLRSLGALEGIALATAWLVASAPTWWPRDGVRRASTAHAALLLTLAAAGLYGPVVASLRVGAADAYLLTLVALGMLGPTLLTLTFRPRAAEASDSGVSAPYREPIESAPQSTTLDASSLALFAALLLPWLLHEHLRGAILSASRSLSCPEPRWRGKLGDWEDWVSLDQYASRLALAMRWDCWLLSLAVVSSLVALARGADRRVVRAWAVAVALLTVGDVGLTARGRALHGAVRSAMPQTTWLWTPGAAWLDDAPTPWTSTDAEIRWTASGAETRVPRAARTHEVRMGPLVHLDANVSGRAWESHLRRWRASSQGDVLTVYGSCAPEHDDTFLSDPRHEVLPSNVSTVSACPTVIEVAAEAIDPSDTQRVVVRVTGPWSARVRDPLTQRDGVVDLHTWRPDARLGSVVVVPERDDVRGVAVVSAARRLRDGRVRVLLGWRGEPRSPTQSP